MAGDGGRVPDVSEQRVPCPRCSGQGVEEVPAHGSWEEHGTIYAECPKCNGAGVLTGQGHIAQCRDCDGSGRSPEVSDPASVLAALLAESPEATVAAIEALLTSDEAVEATTLHLQTEWAGPYMARIADFTDEEIKAVGLRQADRRAHEEAAAEARRALVVACRSLLSKAPKEDGDA